MVQKIITAIVIIDLFVFSLFNFRFRGNCRYKGHVLVLVELENYLMMTRPKEGENVKASIQRLDYMQSVHNRKRHAIVFKLYILLFMMPDNDNYGSRNTQTYESDELFS